MPLRRYIRRYLYICYHAVYPRRAYPLLSFRDFIDKGSYIPTPKNTSWIGWNGLFHGNMRIESGHGSQVELTLQDSREACTRGGNILEDGSDSKPYDNEVRIVR